MFTSGSHHELKQSLNTIGTGVAIFEACSSKEYQLISANHLFEALCFGEVDELVGRNLSQLFPRYLLTQFKDAIGRCIQVQDPVEMVQAVEEQGQCRWWRISISPIVDSSQSPKRVFMTCIDITEKVQLEKSLEVERRRYEAVVDAAYDGILVIDSEQNIRLMNSAANEMFGTEEHEMNGQAISRLIPKRYRSNHHEYVSGFKESPIMSRPMHSRANVRGLRKDGDEFPAEITISKIKVGENTEMTAVIRDVSEKSRLIEELKLAASRDSLTSLYNRRHCEKILEREIKRSLRFGHHLSIVMIDIDHFKSVNDQHGHPVGDRLLEQFARLVEAEVRDIDIFSRWGGEEFLLILPETNQQEAMETSTRIQKALHQRNGHSEQNLAFTVSFGVAEISEKVDTGETLIKCADSALYTAKSDGRDCIRQYSI